jgi:cysteine desulfurase
VTTVGVDGHGVVDLDALRAALSRLTLVVSFMHANNEVGRLQPIREIAELAHAHGALLHTDAAQSTGKIGVDVGALGADLPTLAGHKLYAPKGVGALMCAREYGWSRSCTGADRKAADAPAPRTCPTRSGSERRARSRGGRCRRLRIGSLPGRAAVAGAGHRLRQPQVDNS